ncbi:MAG: PAS domain-containing protein, partial [Anaerolineae bacterium]|nr:PAS domain-containing protein [Anaerolineae bacterium]
MHVLMIEDHENDYLLLRRCAERIDGVRLAWCSTLAQGMDYLDTQAVDVVLLDMTLSDAHGLPMLDRLYTQHPALPVIVLSISEDDELALRAVQHRAQDYLVKGHFNEEILKRALRYAVERKRIEHALDTERRLVRTLIDSVPDYIFVKDTQSRFVVANKAMLDAGSMSTMDEIVGKTDFDFHPTEIAQKFYDKEQQLLATGEKFINEEEVAFDFQTGDKLWFLTTKMPLRDVQGNITGLIGVSRNITQRKQFEEKLQEERALLRTLIDSSPDYIFIKDTQGRYVINNIAHARSVNATPKDLIGKTVLDVLPSNIAAQVHVDDEHVLKSGKPLINLERVTLNEDGATRMMLVTKIPLHDENGQVTGLVGISRDITDRKQLDARTLELAAERERILVLQRLISDLSHDLRTPLTIINNSLYLLHKIPDPQKQQPHLERMEAQVLRLDKLLGELLQMAQLDQQGTDLELDQAELNSL